MTTALLQLDFRRPPRSGWRWVGWAGLVAAVVLVLALSEHHAEIAQRHAAASSRHALLDARARAAAPRPHAVVPDPRTLADVKRANAVIDQLTVPWDALFDAVEAADARGLGLLSLTPNARERTLRLAGEARSMAELLAYVERMAAQPALHQVHLLGYANAVRDGVAVVSFTLAARWRAPE